jgi:hypothetical protein
VTNGSLVAKKARWAFVPKRGSTAIAFQRRIELEGVVGGEALSEPSLQFIEAEVDQKGSKARADDEIPRLNERGDGGEL